MFPECFAEGFPFWGLESRGPGGDQKSLCLCSQSVGECRADSMPVFAVGWLGMF